MDKKQLNMVAFFLRALIKMVKAEVWLRYL